MINIFAISVLLAGQPLQVSARGFRASGLKYRAECSVPLSGTLYHGPGIEDSIRVRSYILDSEIEAKGFGRIYCGEFGLINSNDQIEPIVDPVIDEIRLTGFGKFDSVEHTKLVLTENDRDFDPVIPESKAYEFGTMESTESGVIGDSRGFFEPMHFRFIGFIGTTDYGYGSDHKLGRDARFSS